MFFRRKCRTYKLSNPPWPAPVQRAPPDRPRHRLRKPIRQTRMQPFVRIRRHRFRSSFLSIFEEAWYLELAAWRPLAASVTIMHAHAHHIILRQEPLVSLPRRIFHVQLSIAHIDDLTSAPHVSSPKRLPTCSSNLSPPHASIASACIPRLRMHPSPPHASPSSARRMHRLERRAARLERRAGAITVAEGDTRALR